MSTLTGSALAAESPDGKEYRLPKSYLVVGIAATALFSGMGVLSFVGALLNADESFARPLEAAILFAAFYAFFIFLGILHIVAYYRGRLYLSHQSIRAVGCFRTRTLELASTSRAVWRTRPVGGSIVLHGPDKRVVVYFANFGRSSREIVAFFQQGLPERVQENWQRFETWIRPAARIRRSRRLIYLLVAIAIVTLLLALLLPVIR